MEIFSSFSRLSELRNFVGLTGRQVLAYPTVTFGLLMLAVLHAEQLLCVSEQFFLVLLCIFRKLLLFVLG